MFIVAVIIAFGPAKDAMGANGSSLSSFLRINQVPTTTPTVGAVFVGDTLTITANATGIGPFAYSWTATAGTGSINITNGDQDTVTVTGNEAGDCTVACDVTNTSGTMSTQAVTITVLAVPTISIQIASVGGGATMLTPAETGEGYEVNVLPTGALVFTAVSSAAANTSFTTCTWKKNGVTITAGATLATNGLSDNFTVSFPSANTMSLAPTHVDAQELDTSGGYTVDATFVATP